MSDRGVSPWAVPACARCGHWAVSDPGGDPPGPSTPFQRRCGSLHCRWPLARSRMRWQVQLVVLPLGAARRLGSYEDTIGINHAMTEDLASGHLDIADPHVSRQRCARLHVFRSEFRLVRQRGQLRCGSATTGEHGARQRASMQSRHRDRGLAASRSGAWDAASQSCATTLSIRLLCSWRAQLARCWASTSDLVASRDDPLSRRHIRLWHRPVPAGQEISQVRSEWHRAERDFVHDRTELCSGGCPTESSRAQIATYSAEDARIWGPAVNTRESRGTSYPDEYLVSRFLCPTANDCVTAGLVGEQRRQRLGRDLHRAGRRLLRRGTGRLGQPSNLNFPYVDDISCVTTVTDVHARRRALGQPRRAPRRHGTDDRGPLGTARPSRRAGRWRSETTSSSACRAPQGSSAPPSATTT